MKVSDLIERLRQLPPEAEVVVMDYRGNLDRATTVEHHEVATYWLTDHGVPPVKGPAVEIG